MRVPVSCHRCNDEASAGDLRHGQGGGMEEGGRKRGSVGWGVGDG